MRRWDSNLFALLLSAMALLAAHGAQAARLDYRGDVLSRRQAEGLVAGSLQAPGDSAAVARGLGVLVAELQSRGYLDARARGAWDAAVPGLEPMLRVDVVEGPRYRWTATVVDAPPVDSALFAAALGLRAGDWASPRELAEAVKRGVRAAAENGHPYAELDITELDWRDGGARLRVSGTLGPKVTVSTVRFEGLEATRPALARQAMGRLSGRAFSPEAAEAGRERLLQLGLFRRVEYVGLEGEGDWARGRLVYRVEEPRYNRFEGALGLLGDRGAAGLVQLELDNLAGSGRAVGFRWEARGRPAEALSARYREPLLFGTPLRAEAMLEHQREDSLFTRARWGARLSFLLPGSERLEAGYEQDRVLDRASDVAEAEIQSTVFALERDRRDSPQVARRGTRVRIAAAQSFKREELRAGGSRKSRSSAVEARMEWHHPLMRRSGVAWQLSGAMRHGSDRVLAAYERYALGGAGTLRGRDELALRVDRYALSRLEWRWFTGAEAQHLALFWDHAWTFTRLPAAAGTHQDLERHHGVGIGLRVDSPAGLIGVDYGLQPGRPPAEGKLHLQLVSSF
jgi:outer membrane protein assembly factor BamA